MPLPMCFFAGIGCNLAKLYDVTILIISYHNSIKYLIKNGRILCIRMIPAEPITSETQCNTREDRTTDTSRVNEFNIYILKTLSDSLKYI